MIFDTFTISGLVMSAVMTIVVFYLSIHNQPYDERD
jgi:hypothetical protein